VRCTGIRADPTYHYVRLSGFDEPDEILIVGGEDHKTGQAEDTEERFARLLAWARPRFPLAGEPASAWSGQVLEPIDGLAFIGLNPGDRHTYIVTGDSGNGMTHGTVAGLLITDLIQGRENPWATLYDPGRLTLRAATRFARENLNVAVQYAAIATGGDVESAAAVRRGSGALVREGLRKIAVYRDEHGGVHRLSAACPHLGCIVTWNDTERTWDCPCHGSRFGPTGQVLNGPAITPLRAMD
jgi:nitrite reductase/ring-hydroxylating ferredoxin subunit